MSGRRVLEQVEGSTKDYPFHTVLVAFAERLPDGLLLWCLAGYADARASSVRAWGILLDLAKLDAFRGYVMSSIRKVEHAPECGIGVRFRDLEEWQIGRIWRREGQFVDRRQNAGIGYRPLEVP